MILVSCDLHTRMQQVAGTPTRASCSTGSFSTPATPSSSSTPRCHPPSPSASKAPATRCGVMPCCNGWLTPFSLGRPPRSARWSSARRRRIFVTPAICSPPQARSLPDRVDSRSSNTRSARLDQTPTPPRPHSHDDQNRPARHRAQSTLGPRAVAVVAARPRPAAGAGLIASHRASA